MDFVKMSSPEPRSFVKISPRVIDVEASPPTKVVMKHVKCVQLNKGNYYSWEAQFLAMLRGFNLIDYVEGNVDLTSPMAR